MLLPIEDKSPGTIAKCTTTKERRQADDPAFESETASGTDEDTDGS